MIRFRASVPFFFAVALWGSLFFTPRLPILWLGVLALTICSSSLTLLPVKAGRSWRAGLRLAALGLGLGVGLLRLWPYPRPYPGGLPLYRVAGFRGVLVEDSSPAGDGTAYRVRLDSVWTRGEELKAAARGEVLVLARSGQRLYWGREVRVAGGLSSAREPGAARFVSRAAGITASGYRCPLLARRAVVHEDIERRFAALGRPVAVLLSALLLGNRAGVPEADLELFRASGSLHVLALSGMHIGILFGLVSLALAFLPDRRWRLAVASLLVLPYLFLTGASPSLLRAVFMLLAAALGLILDRDAVPLDLLALAAAAILLLDPLAAFELSFQLSFLALLGMLLAGPPLRRLLAPVLPPVLAAPLALSIGAQAATAPLLLARFGVFYPAGALAALALIPLVTGFLWGGLACLALSLLPLRLLPFLAWPMQAMQKAIVWVLQVFALLPPLRASWRPWYWLPVAALFAGFLVAVPRRWPLAGKGGGA
jgi:ComEC/Rec2-related protein